MGRPCWEVLVKWAALSYDHCTWESETSPFMRQPPFTALLADLWSLQARVISIHAHHDPSRDWGLSLDHVRRQPPFARGPALLPHQRVNAAALLRIAHQRSGACLADEDGLGKAATVAAAVQGLRELAGRCTKPVLVVSSLSGLDPWASELALARGESAADCIRAEPDPEPAWARLAPRLASRVGALGPDLHPRSHRYGLPRRGARGWRDRDLPILVYRGSALTRAILAEEELWLEPWCLDGRGPSRARPPPWLKQHLPEVSAVVVSHEAVVADAALFRQIDWQMVVLDAEVEERHPSIAAKTMDILLSLR